MSDLDLLANPPTLRLLLVDDNLFNRQGMCLYLQGQGFQVCEAGDEASAWGLCQQRLDAAVIDISIPPDPDTPSRPEHSFGIHLARRLKEAHPTLGVVLFSAYEDRGAEVLDMVRDGVRGMAYKLKGCQPRALLQAIHEVLAGRVLIDPEVHANRPALADELLNRLTPDERSWVHYALQTFDQLTPREVEIAQRVAASHNTSGIARALSITPKSVENYIARIYDKLGLNEMAPGADLRKVVLLAKVCMIHDLRRDRAHSGGG
ncbi:MAG: response regulator transcription factor [Chloroflexota bacterium]